MKHRNALPQLNGKLMLTDGGLETWMIFKKGIDLPLFAAFKALETQEGTDAIGEYLKGFAEIAIARSCGFVLDTPTWRASSRWATELGVDRPSLEAVHRDALGFLMTLRDQYENVHTPIVINGVIGPQDDGYNPQDFLTADGARDYHRQQATWFEKMGADMISAITMTYVEEAIGIARAGAEVNMPTVISFTVETDGNLPSGQPLGDAIQQVDRETGDAPAYYMINCAHPDHFADVIADKPDWLHRVMGVRANASRMSHEELDAAEELDAGDPQELGRQYRELQNVFPNLMVMGGCCGTDHEHVDAISKTCCHDLAMTG